MIYQVILHKLRINLCTKRNAICRSMPGGMGSEDFASYTYELPCAYLLLGAGTAQEDARYGKPMHNESVVFNENILPRGSALLAYGAMQWLEDRQ